MNRKEEYRSLTKLISRPPPELEGCVDRAVNRARRSRRPWHILGSAAAVWALFVLLVNASPAFAVACAKVPFLKELTAVVAFSPSLKAAVEHDFVQYVGQSQTAGGLTVTLEYVIADESQMIVFYRTSSGAEDFSILCGVKDRDGNPLDGYSLSQSSSQEELKRFTLHLWKELPAEGMILELRLRPWGEEQWEDGGSFAFSLHLDPRKTAPKVVLPVGQWVDLDGQRLLADRLELTPTRTALYLDDDPANTCWLEGLQFYFTDSAGCRYDQLDGSLGAVGRGEGGEGVYTYFYQSLYFVEHPERLTLHITQAAWLDKNAGSITVDLVQGTAEGLPQGITLEKAERSGSGAALWFTSRGPSPHSALSNAYYDPEGGEHFVSEFSFGEQEDGSTRQRLFLDSCPWDSVTLAPAYTAVCSQDPPLEVALG